MPVDSMASAHRSSAGQFDFTADIVAVDGVPVSKTGRGTGRIPGSNQLSERGCTGQSARKTAIEFEPAARRAGR